MMNRNDGTTTSPVSVNQAVDEYVRMKGDADSLALSVLETALFIEETFHVTLTDADVEQADLRSAGGIKKLVVSRRGGTS